MSTQSDLCVSESFSQNQQIVGRFAPSPTGELHFGSLVAALASYLSSRFRNGQWIVRIEDIDEGRCRPEFGKSILDTLEFYGFEWDGEVVLQSRRKHFYTDRFELLKALGQVYPCSCSRKDLSVFQAIDGTGDSQSSRYPGRCREGVSNPAATQFAHRFKSPDRLVEFKDRRLGVYSKNAADSFGDFVIKRSDGLFSYQLAVVVDDYLQGITEVVRGEDLFEETLKQVCLQDVFALPIPKYSHVPLVTGSDGCKLSKQSGAKPLAVSSNPMAIQILQAAFSHLGLPLFDPLDFAFPRQVLETQATLLKNQTGLPDWLGGSLDD